MGYVPGPLYTAIFQSLLRARLDGKLHSQQEELDYVQKKFAKEGGKFRVTKEAIRA
jgi:hypothetical protein